MRLLSVGRSFLPFLRHLSTRKCWKCSAETAEHGHFCSGCNTILPLGEENLFDYVGLPTKFSIDDALLKKKFRDLQFQLHPDKFSQSTTKEKELSDEHSRRLNEVYKTLSEPLARANYLLSLQTTTEAKEDLDPEQLMEMMEWNEHVAKITDETELREEKKRVQGEIDKEIDAVDKAFVLNDFGKAKGHVTMATYLYSIRNSIDQKIQASLSG